MEILTNLLIGPPQWLIDEWKPSSNLVLPGLSQCQSSLEHGIFRFCSAKHLPNRTNWHQQLWYWQLERRSLSDSLAQLGRRLLSLGTPSYGYDRQ
jgi:hypothetical protein